MGFFVVSGQDRATGAMREEHIEAADPHEASRLAYGMGVLVDEVRLLHPIARRTPPPPPAEPPPPKHPDAAPEPVEARRIPGTVSFFTGEPLDPHPPSRLVQPKCMLCGAAMAPGLHPEPKGTPPLLGAICLFVAAVVIAVAFPCFGWAIGLMLIVCACLMARNPKPVWRCVACRWHAPRG